MPTWETLADDGNTILRRTRRYGHVWHVATNPSGSRWFLNDGRGYLLRSHHHGWDAYATSPYRRVSHATPFAEAAATLSAELRGCATLPVSGPSLPTPDPGATAPGSVFDSTPHRR
jgi:hypothetical protein